MIPRLCIAVSVVLVLAGRVLADPSPPSAEPGNSCHDAASWQAWEALVARNPESSVIHALHALRIGLCLQVDRQALTVEQATAMFEAARQALQQQLREQRQSGKRPADL